MVVRVGEGGRGRGTRTRWDAQKMISRLLGMCVGVGVYSHLTERSRRGHVAEMHCTALHCGSTTDGNSHAILHTTELTLLHATNYYRILWHPEAQAGKFNVSEHLSYASILFYSPLLLATLHPHLFIGLPHRTYPIIQ